MAAKAAVAGLGSTLVGLAWGWAVLVACPMKLLIYTLGSTKLLIWGSSMWATGFWARGIWWNLV